MSQSKKYSWFETLTNIAVGFCVAMVAQHVIFPIFDIHIGFTQNVQIAAFFTVVGIIRMYLMRRFFNWLHVRGFN